MIAGMNAISPAETFLLPRALFSRAEDAVNAWRGRCLHAYARAEAEVTDTLILLSQQSDRGARVRRPPLVGPRFDALTAMIEPGAPFGAEGKKAAAALASFRDYDDLRKALCHGVGSVTLDCKGRWTLVLQLTSLRAQKAELIVRVVEEEHAARIAADITKAAQRLCALLENLRAHLLLKA